MYYEVGHNTIHTYVLLTPLVRFYSSIHTNHTHLPTVPTTVYTDVSLFYYHFEITYAQTRANITFFFLK